MEAKSKSEHEVLRHFSYQFFLSLIMIITLSTLLLLVMTVIRNSQFYRTSGYIIKYLGEEKSAEGLFDLKSLTSGISSTTLSEKLTDLLEKELVLVIHKSQEEANTYNSCAELK